MAAPKYAPTSPIDRPRSYVSPGHVPETWTADRPGEVVGRQPGGGRLGYQGPDQGYGLVLAERFRDRVKLQPSEHLDDAIQGGLVIALRRASLFGRAPTVHDLTVAFTIFGFLDATAPTELVQTRRERFRGVGNVVHHYAEARALADSVPDATLRLPHLEVTAAYPDRWQELVGA